MAPRVPDLPASIDLSGRSVLITGASGGIGLECARQFLQLKAKTIYLAVRSVERGNAAKEDLLNDKVVREKNSEGRVEVYEVDLASFTSVKAFAKKFSSEVGKLDFAIFNAGVSFFSYSSTVDDYETTFQVNYAANALLSAYLLPLLKTAAADSGQASHMTFVSSTMQHMTSYGRKVPIQEEESIFEYFNKKSNMGIDRYGVTKLLLSMWSDELARRIQGEDVVITSLCPGLVQTNIDSNSPSILKYFMRFIRSIAARTSSEGARTVTLASLEGKHGKYYSDTKETNIASFISSEPGVRFQKRLWGETWERFHAIDPDVPTIA